MKHILDLPEQELLEAEAAAWIAQLDSDKPPTQADLDALREWVGRSPRHRAEIERLAVLWDDLNLMTELAGTAPISKSAETSRRSGMWGGFVDMLTKPLVQGAAVVILMLGLAVGLINGVWMINLLPASNVYITATGKQQFIELPDGSTVLLNTNSRLEVDYQPDARNIYLYQGEAHFEVAKNPERPFQVFARDGLVQAVGTAFSVYLRQSEVEVTVTEGKVRLAKRQEAPVAKQEDDTSESTTSLPDAAAEPARVSYIEVTLLEVGESVAFAGDEIEPIAMIEPEQLERKLSWHKGMLEFSGETLEDVVAEVSRYTTTSIVISDPSIRKLKIGGQFRVDDIEQLFAALETVFGVQVVYLDKDIVKLSSNRG